MNRGKAGGLFQPQSLDIDENIFDRNLRIVDETASSQESEFNALFGGGNAKAEKSSFASKQQNLLPQPDLPSIQVTPDPGMCVKTKNVSGRKVFINICKIQEIPPAPPMTEQKLRDIIANEDYTSDYRVPMSLGAPREEKDKAGSPCLCSDVALNSVWFDQNLEDSIVFVTFVVSVAMEGLCEKYGDEVNLDRQNWTVLKNKKYMGTPQRHHIQQRAKGNKITEIEDERNTAKITEITDDENTSPKSKPLIAEISSSSKKSGPEKNNIASKKKEASITPLKTTVVTDMTPKFKLIREPKHAENPDFLVAEIELPNVKSVREITLDLGEDRIVMEARKAGYLLDVSVPYSIDQESSGAQFHRDKKVLTLTMPLVVAK